MANVYTSTVFSKDCYVDVKLSKIWMVWSQSRGVLELKWFKDFIQIHELYYYLQKYINVNMSLQMINEYNSSLKAFSQTNISESSKCQDHEQIIKFVCLQPGCKMTALLCAECLTNHRTHKWQTLTKFYGQIKKIVSSEEQSSKIQQLQSTQSQVKKLLFQFRKRIVCLISQLESKIVSRMTQIKSNFQVLSQRSKNMNNENIQVLLNTYRKVKSQNNQQSWLQNMKTFIDQSIQQSEIRIVSILKDLQLTVDTNWQKKSTKQTKLTMKSFRQHINEPIYYNVNDQIYFKFHEQLKHSGILLKQNNSLAVYNKSIPKGPVAIATNYLNHSHNKFTIQIVKLTHTAFFFPDTSVFVGVCIPSVVKTAGFRRITEIGKGAYLIGSTGWSYHHKSIKYDRKNVVGWGFDEGDKIHIQLNLQEPGHLLFTNFFKMPLDLSGSQLLSLKPCVTFEADEGAQVRIINPKTQG